jgi:hypothetical protein
LGGIYDVAKGVLKFYMCASFLWLKHEYSATISIGCLLEFLLENVVPCGVFLLQMDVNFSLIFS